MDFRSKLSTGVALLVIANIAAMPLASVLRSAQNDGAKQEKAADPWTSQEALEAAELVREMDTSKSETAPTIVYVGFRTLFEGGHVPGASFHGTASTEKGLAELKKWLDTLPRSANLVIYCGCCPLDRCPNVRPAYAALHEMGFARVRVLVLPKSFAADWVEKGYPMQKGL